MPDLSFNLTLPDHLAKALVDGVPTADLDAAVKVVKEQVRPEVAASRCTCEGCPHPWRDPDCSVHGNGGQC